VKEGRPIPIRFPGGDEKRIRIVAIEEDKTFSAMVRALCNEALTARAIAADPLKPEPPSPTRVLVRRVLSRGVG